MSMVILLTLIGACIPIVAILSSHQQKMQKLRAEAGNNSANAQRIQQLEQYVKSLGEENAELKKRLGNVETIVADPDFLLGIAPKDEEKETQRLLEALAEKRRKA